MHSAGYYSIGATIQYNNEMTTIHRRVVVVGCSSNSGRSSKTAEVVVVISLYQ